MVCLEILQRHSCDPNDFGVSRAFPRSWLLENVPTTIQYIARSFSTDICVSFTPYSGHMIFSCQIAVQCNCQHSRHFPAPITLFACTRLSGQHGGLRVSCGQAPYWLGQPFFCCWTSKFPLMHLLQVVYIVSMVTFRLVSLSLQSHETLYVVGTRTRSEMFSYSFLNTARAVVGGEHQGCMWCVSILSPSAFH